MIFGSLRRFPNDRIFPSTKATRIFFLDFYFPYDVTDLTKLRSSAALDGTLRQFPFKRHSP
jgi:hypothetical protein